MNINKMLCNKYDKKNKGYVEIGEILADILRISILICYGILFLNGIRLVIFPSTNPVSVSSFEILSLISCSIGCTYIAGIIILIIIYCIYTIKNSKMQKVIKMIRSEKELTVKQINLQRSIYGKSLMIPKQMDKNIDFLARHEDGRVFKLTLDGIRTYHRIINGFDMFVYNLTQRGKSHGWVAIDTVTGSCIDGKDWGHKIKEDAFKSATDAYNRYTKEQILGAHQNALRQLENGKMDRDGGGFNR